MVLRPIWGLAPFLTLYSSLRLVIIELSFDTLLISTFYFYPFLSLLSDFLNFASWLLPFIKLSFTKKEWLEITLIFSFWKGISSVCPLQILDIVYFFCCFGKDFYVFIKSFGWLSSLFSSIFLHILMPFFKECWLSEEVVRFMIFVNEWVFYDFLKRLL